MKKIDIDIGEKLVLILPALLLAIVFSWVPWLGYSIIGSVFPLPDVEWAQATFFTWIAFTLFFWIDP